MSDSNSTSSGSEKNRYVVTSDEIQKAAPITSLRTITSRCVGEVNYINAKAAHDDTELLAEI
ncbi:GABA-specific high-affinity permease, partial [Kluyveromyces marxianus]